MSTTGITESIKSINGIKSLKRINRKNLSKTRITIQIGFFSLVGLITLAGFLSEKGILIPAWFPTCLHGICPFGGAVTLGRLFTQGLFVPRTGTGNLFSLAAALGGTFLFGAFFCGWICPLGSVQDWFWNIGRKLKLNGKKGLTGRISESAGKKAEIADRVLSWLRYAVLGLILYATFRSVNLVFAGFDPFYALFHMWTGTAMLLSIAVLAAVLAVSLFVYRPWCRWLCPLGAIQGIAAKIAPWTIRKNSSLCIDCAACDKACSFGIKPSAADAVRDSRCSRCLECVAACPKSGALVLGAGVSGRQTTVGKISGNRFTISSLCAAAAVVLISFFVPLAAGAGWRVHKASAQALEHAAAIEMFVSADEISGTFTIEETAPGTSLSIEELLALLELPADFDVTVRIRDIEEYEEDKTLRWIRNRIAPVLEQAE